MNSIRIIIVAIFCLLSINMNGQEISYSEYENYDFRSGDFDVVGKVGDYIYVYRSGIEGYYLDAYNDQMERKAKVILDFLPKRVFRVKFVTYKDKLMLLYQVIESGELKLYAATLNSKGMLAINPRVIVKEKAGVFGAKNNLFSYAVSDDKETILIYGTATKGTELVLEAIWIDQQCEVQTKTNASYAADNNVANGDVIVNNNGELFLAMYTPVGARQYADRLWLLALPKGGKEFVSSEMMLNNMFASGTFMELDNRNNRIYVGGFYSDKKNGHFIGATYTYYDIAGKEFIPTLLLPFNDRLLTASGEKNKKRAFDDYRLKKIVVKNNGGFVLMAERFYATTRSSYTPGFGYYSSYFQSAASSVTEYNYGDMLTVSYAVDGQIEWFGFVRKSQFSYDDGGLFSSFSVINTGGALGILYNDFNTSRSRVQLASIDGSGAITTRTLSKLGNKEPDWLPRYGKQISAREVVVPCLYKRDICFVKVEF